MTDNDSGDNPENTVMFKSAYPWSDLVGRIKVIGVGATGIAAVSGLIADRRLKSLDYLCVGADSEVLDGIAPANVLRLGKDKAQEQTITQDKALGRTAALDARDDIAEILAGTYIAIVVTALGDDASFGASSVIASIAKEMNVLSIAMGICPPGFEDRDKDNVTIAAPDGLIVAADSTMLVLDDEARKSTDRKGTRDFASTSTFETIRDAVISIVELLVCPMVDLADMRAVLSESGFARIGIGFAEGENRVLRATKVAMDNALLVPSDLKQATGIIVQITGGPNLGFREIHALNQVFYEEQDWGSANIIVGTGIDETLGDAVRVSIVAAGARRSRTSVPA